MLSTMPNLRVRVAAKLELCVVLIKFWMHSGFLEKYIFGYPPPIIFSQKIFAELSFRANA